MRLTAGDPAELTNIPRKFMVGRGNVFLNCPFFGNMFSFGGVLLKEGAKEM